MKATLSIALAESYPFTQEELQQLIDEVKVRCGFDRSSKESEESYVVPRFSLCDIYF